MTRRRQRDRARPPATPTTNGAPAAGPDPCHPPAAGASTTVSAGRVAELVKTATSPGATAEDVGKARAELAQALARSLDLALDSADLDMVLKLTDRLTKLLPAGPAAGPAPEPAAGGGPDEPQPGGAPSAAERFRLLSGELGN